MPTRLFTAIFLSFALMGAAAATDLPARIYTKAPPRYSPVVPAFTWTGAYIGLTAGYGWGHARFSDPVLNRSSFAVNGANVGSTFGYNWQAGTMVFGLETDASLSWLRGSSGLAGPCTACSVNQPWFGTFRGRLGYAPDTSLFYLTGGAAYGAVRVTGPVGFDGTRTPTGWTAGAGFEQALGGRWSAKLEYLYVDLGSTTSSGGLKTRVNDNIVRLGINTHF